MRNIKRAFVATMIAAAMLVPVAATANASPSSSVVVSAGSAEFAQRQPIRLTPRWEWSWRGFSLYFDRYQSQVLISGAVGSGVAIPGVGQALSGAIIAAAGAIGYIAVERGNCVRVDVLDEPQLPARGYLPLLIPLQRTWPERG